MISHLHYSNGSCQMIESLALTRRSPNKTIYYGIIMCLIVLNIGWFPWNSAVFFSHVVWDAYAGLWDAVVTCFFIDTAHNIIEYIEVISRILKDGGVRALSLSCKCYLLQISFEHIFNKSSDRCG